MADLIFAAQFVTAQVGKTGLTVTVDVDRYTISDGSRTALVTGGAATEGRRGLYSYRLASADLALYQYIATFITTNTTVDQREIPALGLVVPDVLTSAVTAVVNYASVRTAVGLASANLDTQLAAKPTAAAIRTELSTELGRIDAAISSRLAAASYSAPPSASDNATAAAAAILATPANKLATRATGEASANVTYLAGESTPVTNLVLALANSGYVLAKLADNVVHGGSGAQLNLKKLYLWNDDPYGVAFQIYAPQIGAKGLSISAYDEQNTGLYTDITGASIKRFVTEDTGETEAAAGSVAALAGGKSNVIAAINDLVQADWRAGETPGGALSDLYNEHAVDALTDNPTNLTAEGDTGFAAWVMQEFDGLLFVGVGKTPMNHIAAVIGSAAQIDSGISLDFEYALPEEGVMAMCAGPDGNLYVAGVDERENTGTSSVYVRNTSGAWTRKQTIANWQHICDVFEDGILWIAGQGTSAVVLYSTDGGDTWNDASLSGGRALSIRRLGSAVIVTHWDGAGTYTVKRSLTTPTFSWSDIYASGGIGRLVEWNGKVAGSTELGRIFTVDTDANVLDYIPPFTLRQTYNNLVVDIYGYLCALAEDGVWRTPDLVTWRKVWTPALGSGTTIKALGVFGDSLVVSTSGADATIFIRLASPEHVPDVAAIKETTDIVDSMIEADGAQYRFTAEALEEAPEGSDIFIYTLTYGGLALPGALIEAYSDAAMTQILDYGITDAYGKVRLALDLPGTFYIKRTKVGYSFVNPDTEVVA